MKQELREEVSFGSGLSETSSISDDLQNNATIRELPQFLLLDPSDADYEPRGDMRKFLLFLALMFIICFETTVYQAFILNYRKPRFQSSGGKRTRVV